MTLSARVVKFLCSGRGIAITAAILIGGLAFMWWSRFSGGEEVADQEL